MSKFPLKIYNLLTIVCLIFSLLFTNTFSKAQSCGCDITVPLSQTLIDGANNSIQPGKVICLTAGTRQQLKIRNLTGTAANPIIIKNCGGKVNISASYGYGMWIENSKFFQITGTGSSDQYGITVNTQNKTGSVGIKIWLKSTNVELDHVEVYNTGFAAIEAKSDPKCDLSTNRGVFTMYDLRFHDNYVHESGSEGFYIGFSFPSGYSKTSGCTGTILYPHDIVGCKIYNNKVLNAKADGIQVSCVTSGFEMYNNEIINYGVAPFAAYQNSGIMIGGLTGGVIYNNLVKNGPGNGINISGGSGSNLVYNNVVVDAGDMGIFVDELPGIVNNQGGYKFINNTIINAGIDGIRFNTELTPNNQAKNNIIINPGSGVYIRKQANVSVAEITNFFNTSISSVNFTNSSTGDYSLQSSSLAKNAGTNVSSLGIISDKTGNPRPSGSSYDIGAYEFQEGTTVNITPIVLAGIDQSITLPTNSITLNGSAIDSDGTISTYLWTKQSGGNASLNNTSSANLSVLNLVAGIYIFRLTATDNAGASSFDELTLTVNSALNQMPIVNAGTDNLITLPLNSLTINAVANDVDGTISTYSWTKQSGGNATLTNSTTKDLLLTDLLAGTYIFRLTVTDNLLASSFDEVTVTVNSTLNQMPMVNAGTDKSITLPLNSLTINAVASDVDGTISTYSWTKQSGGNATLTNSTTKDLLLSDLLAGTYIFRLTVTDNLGASAFDEITISVINSGVNIKPIVNAGANQTHVLPNNSTILNSTASDPDGTIVSYLWKKLSGSGGVYSTFSSPTLNLSSLVAGNYNFRLTVTDNSGATSYDDVLVSVANLKISSLKSNNYLIENGTLAENLTVSIYPNPAKDQVNFDISGIKNNNYSIRIFDILGKMILEEQNLSDRTYIFERKELKAGMYLISVSTESETISGKLIFE